MSGNVVAERLGQDRGVFPAVNDRDPAFGPMLARAWCCSRSARAAVRGSAGLELMAAANSAWRWERGALFQDEPAQCPAVTEAFKRTGHQSAR